MMLHAEQRAALFSWALMGEAGAQDAAAVLLFHSFPTSSFQYRELIPRLRRSIQNHCA